MSCVVLGGAKWDPGCDVMSRLISTHPLFTPLTPLTPLTPSHPPTPHTHPLFTPLFTTPPYLHSTTLLWAPGCVTAYLKRLRTRDLLHVNI